MPASGEAPTILLIYVGFAPESHTQLDLVGLAGCRTGLNLQGNFGKIRVNGPRSDRKLLLSQRFSFLRGKNLHRAMPPK